MLFPITIWVIGIVAFLELLVFGVLLVKHVREMKLTNFQATIPLVLPQSLDLSAKSEAGAEPQSTLALPNSSNNSASSLIENASQFSESDLTEAREWVNQLPKPKPAQEISPPIPQPRVEFLLKEAQQLRIAGDMMKSLLKLKEAETISPNDPNLLYELGVVNEDMGVYDLARQFYTKVFQLGSEGAGSLYDKAAQKLKDGLGRTDQMQGKMMIDRVRVMNDLDINLDKEQQKVRLGIPIQKAPDAEIDPSLVSVAVRIFNKNTEDGKISEMPPDTDWASYAWTSQHPNWQSGTEELKFIYTIPKQASYESKLQYYGYIASLIYKNDVIDIQAWPRDLLIKLNPVEDPTNNTNGTLPNDVLPPGFDPNTNPLLPSLK